MSKLIINIIICTIQATVISVIVCKVWKAISNRIFKKIDDKRDEDDTL
jgi:hypothetical protein